MTYNYLLFDLPSDHEVEGVLSTECDVIRAILANNGEGRNVKVIKATTSEALCHKSPQQPYGQIKIVHVACHARDNGVSMIGDSVEWSEFGNILESYVPQLGQGERRTLCLSCCYSKFGNLILRQKLRNHFTDCLYFKEDEVYFSATMVIWSMFYLRSRTKSSLGPIRNKINEFVGPRKKPVIFDRWR